MTSNNFFRSSFFQPEEQPIKKPLFGLHNPLTPWGSNEEDPMSHISKGNIKKSKSLKVDPFPHYSFDTIDRNSNLFNHRKLRMMGKRQELSLYQLPQKPRPLQTEKKAKELGVSIQQFLALKHQEKLEEESLHKKSMEIINQSLQNSFLARRKLRNRQSNTIDLRRDLLNPLQIYKSQQIVQFQPKSLTKEKKEFKKMLGKYHPLKNQRYHF